MRILRNVNPVGAIADFLAVWRQVGRGRWLFVGLAMATSIAIFSLIAFEEAVAPPRLPTITYINSWSADRSAAEIRDSNIWNEQHKEALAARQAAADAEVRHIYKAIGRASGMDVEAIDRKGRADAAREAAATKAKRDASYAQEAAAATSAR